MSPSTSQRQEPNYKSKHGGLLKIALWEAWGKTCYWCHERTLSVNTQSDHLVPRAIFEDETERSKAVREGLIPEDFDGHALTNLGPICIGCNGRRGKSDRFVRDKLPLRDKQDAVAEHIPAVLETYWKYLDDTPLSSQLFEWAYGDFVNPEVRESFNKYAPVIAQAWIVKDPARLDVLETVETLYVDDKSSAPEEVRLTADGGSRRTRELLEALTGESFAEVLDAPLRAVRSDLEEQLETRSGEQVRRLIFQWDSDAELMDGELNAGPVVREDDRQTWWVSRLSSERHEGSFKVFIEGRFTRQYNSAFDWTTNPGPDATYYALMTDMEGAFQCEVTIALEGSDFVASVEAPELSEMQWFFDLQEV